jgi:hypothetical protein
VAIDAGNPQPVEWAAALTARFASASPYDILFAIYRQSGAGWNRRAQGYMLAYLMRWNSERALPLLRAALPASVPEWDMTYALSKASYIPALDTFWRERLAGSPPAVAAQAAFEMSQTGGQEDQEILRSRLGEWRNFWKGREIPRPEAELEGELAQAVMSGAHWRMTEGGMQAIASGCVSETCRTRFASLAAR